MKLENLKRALSLNSSLDSILEKESYLNAIGEDEIICLKINNINIVSLENEDGSLLFRK